MINMTKWEEKLNKEMIVLKNSIDKTPSFANGLIEIGVSDIFFKYSISKKILIELFGIDSVEAVEKEIFGEIVNVSKYNENIHDDLITYYNTLNVEDKDYFKVDILNRMVVSFSKKDSEKLGVVYTPIEVVDFILNSTNAILQKHFNKTISDDGIKIFEPFVGVGTFINRLFTLFKMNLSNTVEVNEYDPFAWMICKIAMKSLTHTNNIAVNLKDTFSVNTLSVDESDIALIIGNPPYSVGQKNANDDNQNYKHPFLEQRIKESYVQNSFSSSSVRSLYDSYVKAIRWASDRIKGQGVIAFVTNGGFIDGVSHQGLRKCLYEEFNSIYIFNLRGNIRLFDKREGENIFGSGCMTNVSIVFLVKDSNNDAKGLYYKDIGESLKRSDKLNIIEESKSLMNIINEFSLLLPDKHSNWINQQNDVFEKYVSISDENNNFFNEKDMGIVTNRDSWVINFGEIPLAENINRMVNNYNQEVEKVRRVNNKDIDSIIDNNQQNIKWSQSLKQLLIKRELIQVNDDYRDIMYRPFVKKKIAYNPPLIHRIRKTKRTFPNNTLENLVINLTSTGNSKDFSVLITNVMTDLHLMAVGTRVFPLYFYNEERNDDLFQVDQLKVDNVSDYILNTIQEHLDDSNVTKEDIFYYVYGVLHSPEYKEKFANDLKKTLPRIPIVQEFYKFMKAGRELATLHLNYEKIEPFNADLIINNQGEETYKVKKMSFGKLGKNKDKSVILFNDSIKINNIPEKAYEYIIDGRSAIEWIMDQYQVKIDKKTGILDDPNMYSEDEKYILNLLLRIINVALKTVDIVNNLPRLGFK